MANIMTNQELWQAALGEIELNISKANFITWFNQTNLINNDNGLITIGVPSAFCKDWLINKYHKLILKALRNVSSGVKEISFIIANNSAKKIKPPTAKTKTKTGPPILTGKEQSSFQEINESFEIDPETNLNPKYHFDSFVVGPFNELAHAASQAVIKNLGQAYNPLFIYGGVGLGKTHLLQAIGNEIIKHYENRKKARYISSQQFTNEFIHALHNNQIKNFQEKCRKIDVLIIDDIQFLANKKQTQEEFFHTFNTLYQKNKQIIISSDRQPQAIPVLDERLRSRFEGGMIADISFPNIETRLAILKAKAEEKKINISESVLDYIATHFQKNIRELEGALNRVIIHAKMNNIIPNEQQTKKLLANIISRAQKKINYKNILQAVANFYDIDIRDLINKSRKKEVVRPRQIAMFLMRKESGISYPYIGEKLGGRDHTTVMYAFNKLNQEIDNNESLQQEINLIKERIYNSV